MRTIKIREEMQIPGTDIILEKGDKIQVLEEGANQTLTVDRFAQINEEFELEPGDRIAVINREPITESKGFQKLAAFWQELKKIRPEGTIHALDRAPFEQFFTYSGHGLFQGDEFQIFYRDGEIKKLRVYRRGEEVTKSIRVIDSGVWVADRPAKLAQELAQRELPR